MRKITDYGDYILGKKYTEGEIVEPARMSEEDVKELKRLLAIHPTAVQNLSLISSPKLFYTKEPDMKNDIPPAKREEYFYAAKIGKVALTVPSKLIYFIELAIKEYGSPNYFLYLMQENDLDSVFSKGYLSGGMTVKDVIANLSKSPSYLPLAEGRYKSVTGENQVDIFIEEENAIAMLPKDLSDVLSFADIQKLRVENKCIKLQGKPIAQLGNYVGVVNSTYDLRNII